MVVFIFSTDRIFDNSQEVHGMMNSIPEETSTELNFTNSLVGGLRSLLGSAHESLSGGTESFKNLFKDLMGF